MQIADASEVLNMLDGDALEAVIRRHAAAAKKDGRPFHVVPEVEAIRTERLLKVEKEGVSVLRAAHLTMNRDVIRALAAETLKLPTARYGYAESAAELRDRVLGKKGTGIPCVVKPVMSSSGKGQSVIRKEADIEKAWEYAVSNMVAATNAASSPKSSSISTLRDHPPHHPPTPRRRRQEAQRRRTAPSSSSPSATARSAVTTWSRGCRAP